MAFVPKSFTASATLNASDAETICTVSAAAGLTLTMPAATGSGYFWKVFIVTTVTSNTVVIQVANATDVMQGLVITAQDAADTLVGWETAAGSDTITLNGTTKGGIRGDYYEITDVAAGLFSIRGVVSGTGTEVTPFSAAVS